MVVTSGQLMLAKDQLISARYQGPLTIKEGGTVVVQDTRGNVTYHGPLNTTFEALLNVDTNGAGAQIATNQERVSAKF